MKPFWSLAILLTACGAAAGRPTLPARDPPVGAGAAPRPHPAVVRVIVPEGSGMSLGSGALVAKTDKLGLVVTNWHVVCDAQGQIVVAFPDGSRSGATLLRTDRDWDLAALAIWRPNAEPIPLALRPPRPGEPLTIAGYGSDRYRAVTGRCTQYVAPGRNHPYEMVELAAGARQGDSGGPIFNSRGELAGVLFGAAGGHTTGSYCGRVREFLDGAQADFHRLDAGSTMVAQKPRTRATPVARHTESTRPGSQPDSTAVAQRPRPIAGTPWRRSEPERARTERRADPAAPVASIRAPSQATTRPFSHGAARPSTAAQPSPYQQAAAPPNLGSTGSPPAGPQDAAALPEGHGPPAAQVGQPIGWKDIAGPTLAEQAKSILALIGAAFLFVHGMKLLSRDEEA